MGTIGILIMVALVGTGAVGVGVQQEYIPVGLQTVGPSDSEKLDVSTIAEYEALVSVIPGVEDIQRDVYTSSMDIQQVIGEYDDQLTNRGYSHDYSGVKTVKNVPLAYEGYVKGFTCVGIVLVPGSVFDGLNDETVVLYTTGPITDYYGIYNWAKSNNIEI